MFNAILGCEERDSLSRGGWDHRKMSRFQAGKPLSLAGAGFYLSILDKPNSSSCKMLPSEPLGGRGKMVGWFTHKIVPGVRDVLARPVSSAAIRNKCG